MHNRSGLGKLLIVFTILVSLLILSACLAQQPISAAATAIGTNPSQSSVTPSPPSPTHLARPTFSGTPSPVPSATPTLFPLSIEAMRARSYPGSDLVIEKELTAGSNYKRYYASYLSDGLKIYGLLTIPDGEKPVSGWPVIIFNHGYIPPDVYRTTERYVAYVDMIARNGYIVFKSDYRGHNKSEGLAQGAYGHPDYVVDVLNALATLKRYPQADPNRIGMWGHSMGGYITLRAMVISKDIKAGVIWGGVVASYPDLLTKWVRGPGAEPRPTDAGVPWRSTLVDQYGPPDSSSPFWNSISSNSYLADISGPLQLHHSTTDEEVPLVFSETLFYEMLAAGKYVELYKYVGDNHNISNNFTTAMQRSVDFFDRFVKNP